MTSVTSGRQIWWDRFMYLGDPVAEKHVDFTYDLASQLTDIKRYAEANPESFVDPLAQSHYDYDDLGRLTSIVHGRGALPSDESVWDGDLTSAPATPASDTIAAYHLVYDEANRLDVFNSFADQFSVDYDYDDRNQLTEALYTNAENDSFLVNGNEINEDYGYDDNGNRLNDDGSSRSPDGENNQLKTDGTYTFTYDAEGNRVAKFIDNGDGVLGSGDTEITEYEWDHRNRLTKLTERATYNAAVDKVMEYAYDVFDRRISKTADLDGTGTQKAYRDFYVLDGQHIALEFHDPDADGSAPPQLSHRYLHGPAVDMILADEQISVPGEPGEVLWPLTDHLGSVRDVIDSDGNIVTHFVYNSFGEILDETNPEIYFRFTFTGRERDIETPDLMYYRARYYSSSEGVFISSDPIKDDYFNLYRYVGNHPTYATDPTGLAEEDEVEREEGHKQKTPSQKEKHTAADQARKLQAENAAKRERELRRLRNRRAENMRLHKQAMERAIAQPGCAKDAPPLQTADFEKLRQKLNREIAQLQKDVEKLKSKGKQNEAAVQNANNKLSLKQRLIEALRRTEGRSRRPRRGGFLRLPQMSLPKMRMPQMSPRARGGTSGAGPFAVLVFGEMALSECNDLVGGAIGNSYDNTFGADPSDMMRNMERLFGSEWRFHWSNLLNESWGGDAYHDPDDRDHIITPDRDYRID
jgi:RHS repeat-associated protein